MGRALAPKLVAVVAACLAMPAAALAVGPSQRREGGALFDVRAGKPPARPGAGSARARLQLDKALGPQGVVDTDPLTGGTRVLAKLAGFLSGPAAGDPASIALGYVRAHAGALGLGDADIARLKLVRRYRTLDGITHLTWAQTWHGVPAFDNELRVNVAAGGQVIGLAGSPRGGLSVPTTHPRVSWRRALGRKGRLVGRPRLVLFGEQRGARLAWRLQVKASPSQVYDYVVDARSAKVLRRANKVDSANALVYEDYPGAATGGTQVSQSLDAWLSPGATTLTGPNAHAYLDLNDTGAATEIAPGSYAFSTVASPSGLCPSAGCAWNHLSPSTYTTNEQEAANQAFYYVNKFHDHLASAPISFSQFQGSDKVKVEVDDGVLTGPDDDHIDNANFSTPPAGLSPTMQMYLFGKYGFSDVNGADDASIVYHEYTHGLSNRLITDSSGYGALDTLPAGAMGEAWSDWFAFDVLAAQGDVSDTSTNGDVQAGRYTDGGNHLIREQGINGPVGSSAASGCPGSIGAGHQGGFTYADFGRVTGGGPEVHADGEIWGETLWDIRRALGSQTAEQLITQGMELSPADPSFLDERNAILLADAIDGGA